MKLELIILLGLEGKLALNKLLLFELAKCDLLCHLGVVTFPLLI